MLVTLICFALPGLMEREILDYRAWAGEPLSDALVLSGVAQCGPVCWRQAEADILLFVLSYSCPG